MIAAVLIGALIAASLTAVIIAADLKRYPFGSRVDEEGNIVKPAKDA
jgi:hypothetical protein